MIRGRNGGGLRGPDRTQRATVDRRSGAYDSGEDAASGARKAAERHVERGTAARARRKKAADLPEGLKRAPRGPYGRRGGRNEKAD